MDDVTLQVIGAVIVIVALAAERAAELFGSGIFAILKRYGVVVESKDVKTVVMVLLVTLLNGAVLFGLDLDPIAKLLAENSTWTTIALTAFGASGLSGISHMLINSIGKKVDLVAVARAALDLADELKKEEV